MFLFFRTQYPVHWTAQSTLHVSSPDRTVHSITNSASLGSILAMQQLRATTYHSHFHHTARYSFIQLSELSGILWEKKMPIILKAAVYKTVIRPVLMYRSGTRALRKAEQLSIKKRDENVERDDGIKSFEKTRTVEIRAVVEMATSIREARLGWLGHVERKTENEVVMRTWK